MRLTELEKEKVLACIGYFEKHFEVEMYKSEREQMLLFLYYGFSMCFPKAFPVAGLSSSSPSSAKREP